MSKYRPFLMWLVPLSFFTYQFILRLWPSLTMQQTMSKFSVDAAQYGLLASVYYYGYAGAQIPIAILLDKYGPKKIVSVCACLCGIGMLISVNADIWFLALVGRFLIGVGSAGGFMSTSTVISSSFPSDKYSKMVSLSFSIGLLGAVYGGRPTNELIEKFGFESVGFYLSLGSFLIGIMGYFILSSSNNSSNASFSLSDLTSILRSPQLVALGIANLLMVGSLEGFADVWGVNYLVSAYGLQKSVAAKLVSFVPIGMIFGGPILVLLSKYVGEHTSIFISGVVMTLSILNLLYESISYNETLLSLQFFVLGMMCCYQVLIFAIGNNLASKQNQSLTIAFLNCVNMLGGAFFHTLIGFGISLTATDSVNTIYSKAQYQYGLLIIPACALIGSIIVLILKRRHSDI